MIDIVERLRFDAARCESQLSKGVATNIEEAAAELTRLRDLLARCIPALEREHTSIIHSPAPEDRKADALALLQEVRKAAMPAMAAAVPGSPEKEAADLRQRLETADAAHRDMARRLAESGEEVERLRAAIAASALSHQTAADLLRRHGDSWMAATFDQMAIRARQAAGPYDDPDDRPPGKGDRPCGEDRQESRRRTPLP